MFSEICENLSSSLEYRDNLVSRMNSDRSQAQKYCNDYQQRSNNTIIQNWWWDDKSAQSGAGICLNIQNQLKDQSQYGLVSNVALDLALDSFYTQMQLKLQNICLNESSTFNVFKRQCSKKVVDSGILIFLQDDQIEQVCNKLSTETQSCEEVSWFIVKEYHAIKLRNQEEKYEKLMVSQYLESSGLKNIEERIAQQIQNYKQPATTSVSQDLIPAQNNDQASTHSQSDDSVQTTKQDQSILTQKSFLKDEKQSVPQKQQQNNLVNNDIDDDDDDEDLLNSVPLVIPY
eukprot:403357535